MSLALLGGANPRVCKVGPKVRLHEGNWKLRHVGIVDSILTLHGVDIPFSYPSDQVFKSKGMDVWLEIDKAGTESHISVFAEQVHGT